MPKYLTGADVKKTYGVSNQALRTWANEGKIKTVRTPGGNRLYDSEDIAIAFGGGDVVRARVCYARVSSVKQKEDLDRQIEMLQTIYPGNEVITDIGSGLNYKRPGFNSILERVMRGEISQICVLYRDRLCRFGIEMVEFVCRKYNTTIVVHSHADQIEMDHTQELAEDLLSIVTVFVARNNGIRSGINRKEREVARGKSDSNKADSGSSAEINSSGMDIDSSMDI